MNDLSAVERKSLIRAWIAALRSGEYRQGNRTLRNAASEYCCLGVLCDVYRKRYNRGSWEERDASRNSPYFEMDGPHRCYLPKEIAEAIGTDGDLSRDFEVELVQLNDRDEATFKEIADYIEVAHLARFK